MNEHTHECNLWEAGTRAPGPWLPSSVTQKPVAGRAQWLSFHMATASGLATLESSHQWGEPLRSANDPAFSAP